MEWRLKDRNKWSNELKEVVALILGDAVMCPRCKKIHSLEELDNEKHK